MNTVIDIEAKIEQLMERLGEWFCEKGIDVQRFPLYDLAVELIAKVEIQQYEDFCKVLAGKCIFENQILGNRYKMFQTKDLDVYAYYTAGDNRIRVICSKHMQYPFGLECEECNEDIKIAVLNMSYHEQPGGNNGLCMVLTLGDGRFVIFDSGFMKSDSDRLMQYLNENNRREDGITIAAWVLTHGHEDHYGAFVHFAREYSDCVTVQHFMLNPVLKCGEGSDALIEVADMIKKNYPNSNILIPHSGMKFQLGNLQMEVLFNHEDVRPKRVLTINDASIVMKISANDKTLLMMGDCQWCVPLVQRAMQEYVKCDILQVPHHGDSGGTQEFYNLVDPGTVIYTTSLEKFKQENSTDWYLAPNYYLLNKLHVKNVVVADDEIQTIMIPKMRERKEEKNRIVFVGDSITDCGRNREDITSTGTGYVHMVKGQLGCEYPGKYEYINKGISGNRIVDVYARIKADIINLKPDYMSLLIGVNDVWHELGGRHNGVAAEKFEKIYDMLISEILEVLPDIKIMILEPFVLEGAATTATEAEPERWECFRTEVSLRAAVAKRIAAKYNLPFVTLQDKLDEACRLAPASYWLRDGVHPTPMGHWIIKNEWVKAFREM